VNGLRESRPSGGTSWTRDIEESLRNTMALDALVDRHVESLTRPTFNHHVGTSVEQGLVLSLLFTTILDVFHSMVFRLLSPV
jgi:hypothetical protein